MDRLPRARGMKSGSTGHRRRPTRSPEPRPRCCAARASRRRPIRAAARLRDPRGRRSGALSGSRPSRARSCAEISRGVRRGLPRRGAQRPGARPLEAIFPRADAWRCSRSRLGGPVTGDPGARSTQNEPALAAMLDAVASDARRPARQLAAPPRPGRPAERRPGREPRARAALQPGLLRLARQRPAGAVRAPGAGGDRHHAERELPDAIRSSRCPACSSPARRPSTGSTPMFDFCDDCGPRSACRDQARAGPRIEG